jgi:hypothetical protein
MTNQQLPANRLKHRQHILSFPIDGVVDRVATAAPAPPIHRHDSKAIPQERQHEQPIRAQRSHAMHKHQRLTGP